MSELYLYPVKLSTTANVSRHRLCVQKLIEVEAKDSNFPLYEEAQKGYIKNAAGSYRSLTLAIDAARKHHCFG